MTDQDIDLTDIPEVTDEHIARAKLRVDGKPVSRDKDRKEELTKKHPEINDRDPDILDDYDFSQGVRGKYVQRFAKVNSETRRARRPSQI